MTSARVTTLILVVTFVASVLGEPEPFLTKEEQDAVRDMVTLNIVTDLKANAINIFVRFFSDYPEYQKLFPTFGTVSKEDLPNDKNLLSHAVMIMQKFGSVVVENLDNKANMEQEFYEVAQNHVSKKVGPDHARGLIGTLKDVFRTIVMDKYKGAVRSGWDKVLETLQNAFDRVAKEAQ